MNGVVLILGSGPNVVEAQDWPRAAFGQIVAINNAWRVRDDWDTVIYPEDFPLDRRPQVVTGDKRVIEASQFVPAQNRFGGFVFAGGTMAFTAGYWALHALKPRIMAFLGCDMIYPSQGPTHYYGTGTADPLRDDVTLQDLGAKSARLAMFAAAEGCMCVNLSRDPSELLFPRATWQTLDALQQQPTTLPAAPVEAESHLGYFVPSGRYWDQQSQFDAAALRQVDALWRAAYGEAVPAKDGFAA